MLCCYNTIIIIIIIIIGAGDVSAIPYSEIISSLFKLLVATRGSYRSVSSLK